MVKTHRQKDPLQSRKPDSWIPKSQAFRPELTILYFWRIFILCFIINQFDGRGLLIDSKNCSVTWPDLALNLLNQSISRALMMEDKTKKAFVLSCQVCFKIWKMKKQPWNLENSALLYLCLSPSPWLPTRGFLMQSLTLMSLNFGFPLVHCKELIDFA